MRQPLSRKFKKIKKNQNFDAVALGFTEEEAKDFIEYAH